MIARWQNLSQRSQDITLAVFVAVIALLPRIIGLSRFLTADEPKSWFGRSIQFLDALARADFAATFDSPAPGVTTMWAGSIGLLLEYGRQGFPGSLTNFLANVPFDPLDVAILPLIRLPVVLVAVLTAVLTYLWGKNILGRPAALLAAVFIALDPFLLALSRILGHDGLVTLFMWLSLLAIINYLFAMRQPTPAVSPRRLVSPYLIISGLCGGLAFLTKYPSLFLGAFVALSLLFYHWPKRSSWSQLAVSWLSDVALWSLAAGLIFVLLWPAMWVDPIGRVLAIVNDALRASSAPHPKGSFFLGQPVPDPGATFYLIVTLFKTTPVVWLGWLLLPMAFIVDWRRKRLTTSIWQAVLIILCFSILYGLLVTIGGKKQDRYIVPAFPGLAALAAIGYAQVIMNNEPFTNRLFRTANPALPQLSLLGLIMILQAAFVLPTQPYYFSYYNPLLGGGNAAARSIIVGWGEGLDEAARWLNSQPDIQNQDAVAWYSTTFEPYFKGNAIYKIDEEKISRTSKPGLAADYVILYVNQIQRELPSAGALQHFRAVPPHHVVTLDGTDYVWIYPSEKMQFVAGGEPRLVGQAELLGFNLVDNSGQRLQVVVPDQPTTLQLYWEWQGKAAEEPIRLRLVDAKGLTWGHGQLQETQARFPFAEWQEGMVARNDYALEILPGTPPGDYFLKVWIDRPATGELVGEFPLAFEDGKLTIARPTLPPQPKDLDLTVKLEAPLLGQALTLLGVGPTNGWSDPWEPGQAREVPLYWQANQTIDNDHPLILSLVETEGGLARASWSSAGSYSMDNWQPNDIIRDPWPLKLPANVPPGDYMLTVQLGQDDPVDILPVTVTGRPRLFTLPNIGLPLQAQFGDHIELLGLHNLPAADTLVISPGQTVQIQPVWQAVGLPDADYTWTLQLLNGAGQVVAQRDGMPLEGTAPTSSWAMGEIIPDTIPLDIPLELGPGPHQLLLALYRVETGERLRLPDGNDHLTIPLNIK